MSGGTEQPRDGRSMASPRRSARPETTHRAPSARDPGAPPPLSLERRLGVLVVVGALTASILLAWGGGGSRPSADATPSPSADGTPPANGSSPRPTPVGPVPVVVPVIAPPADNLLMQRRVNLSVTIPEPGEPLKGLELRVYRNGELAMDHVKVKALTMTVRNVPLRRNDNRLVVALANAGGEGPRSEAVVVTVDDRPPRIDIKQPDAGSVVNGSMVTVRGVTDAGLTVTVRNPAFGSVAQVVSDDRGVFLAEVRLDKAENRIEISTVDLAGNPAHQVLNVVRGEEMVDAKLTISKQTLKMGDLPASLNLRLELTDPEGRPVDGAPVTFSIIPPGLPAETYQTVTVAGVARWDDVRVAREGAVRGHGWVNALADLGTGVAPALATKGFDIE